MNVLPEGYNNSLCELRGVDDGVYIVGRIKEITNDYIKIANNNSNLPFVFVNTPVKIQIYNEELGFCLVSGLVYTSAEEFVKVTDTQILTDRERRRFFRVPLKLNTLACMLTGTGTDMELKGEWFKITVNNIGLGGIYFESKRKLELDDCIAVEVRLASGTPINYKIVNMKKEENGKIGYGGSIIHTDNKTTDELCAHIFEWQRKLISEAKGY